MLAIIDAQNDFIDGSMGVGAEKWNKAKKAIFDLVKGEDYDQIIFTKDWHPANHCSFKAQGGMWPNHCVQGEKGAEIDADFAHLQVRALTLNKGMNNSVEEYGINVLQNLTNVKELHLVGLCYDYCVASCAKESAKAYPGVKIVIKKAGTVAIDENAKLDLEGLPILID